MRSAPLVQKPLQIPSLPCWQPATWQDYLACRDDPALPQERARLFFHQGYLFVDMGAEGINHSSISDLFPILFFLWFSQRQQNFKSFGRCLIEQPGFTSASPDQVLYVGTDIPQWREGELRRINLEQWRPPDLVGEVADTTLATDLDEKKQTYAALQVPEYWVVNVEVPNVMAFQLQPDGKYQQCETSQILNGLPIGLLTKTIAKLKEGMTDSAALWFAQQIVEI